MSVAVSVFVPVCVPLRLLQYTLVCVGSSLSVTVSCSVCGGVTLPLCPYCCCLWLWVCLFNLCSLVCVLLSLSSSVSVIGLVYLCVPAIVCGSGCVFVCL